MNTRTASRILALKLSTMLSMALFSTIVVGMHTLAAPGLRSIELPTVVVIGHRADAPNATAYAKTTTPDNS